MAITAAFTNAFKTERMSLSNTHAAADVFKIALYTSAATLSAATTAYSATNEVVGTGYTAGGQTLVGFTPGASGSEAWIDWTTDPVWTSSTITARGAVIYNSSKSNAAIAVLDFGADYTSTNGPFTLPLPAAAAGTAIIRIV